MDIKSKKNDIAKWAILVLLLTWGTISFIVVMGEESSDNPMGFGLFMTYKFFAICSLILCVKTTAYLHKIGWLPDYCGEFDSEDI